MLNWVINNSYLSSSLIIPSSSVPRCNCLDDGPGCLMNESPGEDCIIHPSLQGSEWATEDNHGQKINSQLSIVAFFACKLIYLQHGQISCHPAVSPVCWIFSFLLYARLVWLKWLHLHNIWTAAYSAWQDTGMSAGDLINTWRLCKPFTACADNSHLASNWSFEAIFYVY